MVWPVFYMVFASIIYLVENFPIKEPSFQYNLMELHWDPENTAMRFVTERLAYVSVSNTPDFSLGQYNGHTVGLV